MAGQIAAYIRISSTNQYPDRQIAAVGVGVTDRTLLDKVSGKSRCDRSALAQTLRYVRRGDTVRVASMDRFA